MSDVVGPPCKLRDDIDRRLLPKRDACAQLRLHKLLEHEHGPANDSFCDRVSNA